MNGIVSGDPGSGRAPLLCMGEAAIRGIAVLRDIYLPLLGEALGIAAHYLIAALVGLDPKAASAFALTLPTQLISLLLCPYIIMSVLFARK